MHLYNMVLGVLSVIMCKGTCNIHKSFAEYITFSKMCMGLIFHGKKGNGNLTFLVYQTKLTFWEINTSNGNGKGQDSNGKGQMSHPGFIRGREIRKKSGILNRLFQGLE